MKTASRELKTEIPDLAASEQELIGLPEVAQ
jgi:hypothetical protein